MILLKRLREVTLTQSFSKKGSTISFGVGLVNKLTATSATTEVIKAGIATILESYGKDMNPKSPINPVLLSTSMITTESIPASMEATPPCLVTRFQKKVANNGGAKAAPIMV